MGNKLKSRLDKEELEGYCKWLTDRYNHLENMKKLEIEEKDRRIRELEGKVKTWEHNFSEMSKLYKDGKMDALKEAVREEQYIKQQRKISILSAQVKNLRNALSEMASKLARVTN